MMKYTLMILTAFALAIACQAGTIETGIPREKAEAAITDYFETKHPSYAELNALSQKLPPTGAASQKRERLFQECPVRMIINSWPHGPYMTFTEVTALSDKKVNVVEINLHANEDGTCRIRMRTRKVKKTEGMPVANEKAITEADIRRILKTDAGRVTRLGFLPSQEAQHPLIVGSVIAEGYQGYLDLLQNGEHTKQIIVVYPTGMERPTEKNRVIEITGKLHTFEISKPSNNPHKKTHESEAIEVVSWKYRD